MKAFGFSGSSNLTKTRTSGDTRRIIQATSTKSVIKMMVPAAKAFGIDFGLVKDEPGYRLAIIELPNPKTGSPMILAFLADKDSGNKLNTTSEDATISPLNCAGITAYEALKNDDFTMDEKGNYPLDENGKTAWNHWNHNWLVGDTVYTPGIGGQLVTWDEAIADGIVNTNGELLVDREGNPISERVMAIQARELTFLEKDAKRERDGDNDEAPAGTAAKAAKPKAEKGAKALSTEDFV